MFRELVIRFMDDGNVSYRFRRSGFLHRISRYSIAYPSDKVMLHDGQNMHTADFRQSIGSDHELVLEWDRTVETQSTEDQRIIEYQKVGFLDIISQEPLLFAYKEQLPINASRANCFHLFLHGRDRRISAIKALSQAYFFPTTWGYIHCCHAFLRGERYDCREQDVEPGIRVPLRPTELADAQFYADGILHVDWILEIAEKKDD